MFFERFFMRFILLAFSLFIAFCISANAAFLPFGDRVVATITEISDADRKQAKVSASGLMVGDSGQIVRWFDENHSAIIAQAIVIAVENDLAVVAYEPFTALDQKAFPTPTLEPQENDEVIFRAFNDRAFLIAPNAAIYEKVRDQYKDIAWLHPDLVAAYLLDVGHNSPVKGDFRAVCSQYAVGVVYIVASSGGYAVDCQSFVPIKQDTIDETAPQDSRAKPFYARLGDNSSWFSFLLQSDAEADYYTYYDALLRGEISDDDATFFGRISRAIKTKILGD